jgi:hypothetical protein
MPFEEPAPMIAAIYARQNRSQRARRRERIATYLR